MSKYPGQIDTNAELLPVADNATEIAAESINALREAIFAIERTLGIDPQGSAADLKTRLDQILNLDGTFKSSALTSSGLISLPITNAHIGSSAAIVESKLDLDISTQALQSQISSNDIDINQLQTLYNTLTIALSNHVSGVSQKHDGYSIDITGGLQYASAVTTVGQALDYIHEELLRHENATAAGEHPASAITFTPDPAGPFTATNVQDAITQIDTAFQEDRRIHNDSAHQNGVVNDGYLAYNGQISASSGALRVSRYQPSSGQDQVKIAHLNASAIKTKGLNPLALSSTSQAIDFTVACGNSVRTLSVTGLHTAEYPAGSGRFSVDAIVGYLNAQFANSSNHFPLQAFSTNDGQIVVQSNIDRDDCTVTVGSPAINSAAGALGFSDITGISSQRVESSQLYIDGYQRSQLRVIFSGTRTLTSASSIINLGTVVGSSGLDLKIGSLIHIYNHSDSSAAGTYAIAAVGPPPSTQINLTTTVSAGTFDVVIYDDTVYFGNSSNPRSVDLYLDSNMRSSTNTRYEVSLAPISGISILEVSDDMPAGAGLLQLTTGATNSLQLTVNALAGEPTTFPSGFVGYLNVYANNDTSYIRCLVSSTILSAVTSSVTIYENINSDDKIKIASTYFNGALVIDMPVETSPRGTIGAAQISQEVSNSVSDTIYSASGNGVVSGFAVSATSATVLRVLGGSALISGKKVTCDRVDISVFNKASASGTWNLILNEAGTFEIYDDTYAGYTLDAIISNRSMIALAQFVTSAGSISSVTDARILVKDSSLKVMPTVDPGTENGIFVSLESAQLYSDYDVGFGNRKIQVVNDITLSASFTTSEDTSIECMGSATFSALTLGAGSRLEVWGDLTTSTLTLSSETILEVHGVLTATAISIADGSKINLHKYSAATSVVITGENSGLYGATSGAGLLLGATSGAGITISAADVTITGLEVDILNTSNITAIRAISTATNLAIDNCKISRAGTIGSWSSSMIGIGIVPTVATSGIKIHNTQISNFYTGIDVSATTLQISGVDIFKCEIFDCSFGVKANKTYELSINSNMLYSIYSKYIDLQPNTSSSLHEDVFITQNIFKTEYTGGTGLAISSGNKFSSINISGNVFSQITASGHIIDLQYTDILDTASYNIYGNTFTGCAVDTSGAIFAINYLNPSGYGLISSTLFDDHTGAMLLCDGPSIVSNNVFASQSTAGAPYYSIVLGQDPNTVFSSNLVDTSDDQILQSSNSTISKNYISVGSLEIISVEAGDTISSNYIKLNSTSVSSSISLNYSNPSQNTTNIVDNVIYTSGTTNGILLQGSGYVNISGNTITPLASCTNMIHLMSASSNIRTMLSDNIIHSNYQTVSHSILIEKSSVYAHGNTLGAGSSSPSTAAININGASLEDIFIANNVLTYPASGAVATGARKIVSNSTKDVTILNNKNAELSITYTAINGMQYDTITGSQASRWAFDLSSRCAESSSGSAGLAIPLTNIPLGSEISTCVLYASVPATIGSMTAQLFERDISGISATSISAAVSNAGIGATQITITPSSEVYVTQSKEYFIVLTSTAVSNQIGNIIVNVYN